MRIRVLLALVGLTLLSTQPVRAAATPEPLPEQVEAHIAVRSPLELLGSIDSYVAAATKGTANSVPPGFLGMMAQLYLPVPLDTWESDGETHVLILRSDKLSNPGDINFVAVFGVPDFAAFLESLEERDWLVGESSEAEGIKDVRAVVVPTGKSMVLADLGDGKTALGRDAESVSRALKGWTPSLASSADVIANFSMGGDGNRLRAKIFAMLNAEKDGFIDDVTDAGFKAETAKNLIATAERVLPAIVDEISGMRNMVMELGFEDDTLAFSVGGKSAPETLLGAVAASLAGRGAVDISIGESLPAGAISVGVSAKPSDIIPDAKERIMKLAANVYGGVMPKFKDEIVDLTGEFMDSGLGQTAFGSYIDGVSQYNVSLNMTDDPEKALGAFTNLFELFNKLWAEAIDDPAYGFKFAGVMRGEGEVIFYRYQPVFTDEAKFQSLLDRLTRSRGELDIDVAALKKLRFFVAALEDGIVSASGELDDERFLALLEEVKAPSGERVIASDAARALLSSLPNAQASVGILEAGGIFQLYSAQLAQNAAGAFDSQTLARADEALKRMQASGVTGKDLVGFSFGAEKEWLNSRILVPAGAVNRIVRDVEKYDRASKRAARPDTPAPDAVETPDEYEDDLEEEELGDEDSSAA